MFLLKNVGIQIGTKFAIKNHYQMKTIQSLVSCIIIKWDCCR